jgi:hypothetical protein
MIVRLTANVYYSTETKNLYTLDTIPCDCYCGGTRANCLEEK